MGIDTLRINQEDAKGREGGLRLSIVVAYKPAGPTDRIPFEAVCPELDLVEYGVAPLLAARSLACVIAAHLTYAWEKSVDPSLRREG